MSASFPYQTLLKYSLAAALPSHAAHMYPKGMCVECAGLGAFGLVVGMPGRGGLMRAVHPASQLSPALLETAANHPYLSRVAAGRAPPTRSCFEGLLQAAPSPRHPALSGISLEFSFSAGLPACRSYTCYEELCEDYRSGALHPGDLKPALAKHLNQILQVGHLIPDTGRVGYLILDTGGGVSDTRHWGMGSSCCRQGAGLCTWPLVWWLGACVERVGVQACRLVQKGI